MTYVIVYVGTVLRIENVVLRCRGRLPPWCQVPPVQQPLPELSLKRSHKQRTMNKCEGVI
eukprot:3703745-Amphidinium_carterae.1